MINYVTFSFFILFLFTTCKSQTNAGLKNKLDIPVVKRSDQLHFDSDTSNLITVRATINNNVSAIFILDNATMDNYSIIFDKKFALHEKMLSSGDPRSINGFQDSSQLNIVFGDFNFLSKNNRIMDLPVSKKTDFNALLGMGFLKNYILEIDYQSKYFRLDSVLSIEKSDYHEFQMEKNGMFLKIPIEFFINGKLIKRACFLDLGYGGDVFFWGAGAVKSLAASQIDTSSLARSGNATVTGEVLSTAHFNFDSAIIFHDARIINSKATLSFSTNGVSSSNWVLFGNGILKRFGKVFIDFRTNRLFLRRELQVDN